MVETNKKTFIRNAGKLIFFLDYTVVVLELVLMYQGKSIEGFPALFGFLTFITGFIFGAAGWSDHRKETLACKEMIAGVDKNGSQEP